MKERIFVADFETTVYKGQDKTEVWAAGTSELFQESVSIFHSIDAIYNYYIALNTNLIVYFHNQKFDGSFWLDFFMRKLKYKQALVKQEKTSTKGEYRFQKRKEMEKNTFAYSISARGQWYRMLIKMPNGKFLEIRDSLKLLPFTLKEIGKSFKTKHQKLDMEYEGYRYAGCVITPEEMDYIKNDVLVLKEAMEIMYEKGHTKLTIGSCCLSEYKGKSIKGYDYKELFPDLYKIDISKDLYKEETAGDYIVKSYHGGWCYLVKGKESKLFKGGSTADVNSLYPSVMESESGNRYPVGLPNFWVGEIPEKAKQHNRFYFVRIRTSFKLKKGYLPCIQIKNNWLYKPTEWLERSAPMNPRTGKYCEYLEKEDGSIVPATVEMTLTMMDYELIQEHYELYNTEILSGCWFGTEIGLFDDYLHKYKKIKETTKGAERTLSKLFQNNLYGKFASTPDSSFKIAYMEEGRIKFKTIVEKKKIPGYIAVGSAVTSYARCFTIRAAQKNYHGKNKRGFIYADTDSIHCDLPASELKGITVHPTHYSCWKIESEWEEGYFVRQKTYMEKERGNWGITCAGMPDRCKRLLQFSICQNYDIVKDYAKMDKEEKKFVGVKREITDFNVGLQVPSKLRPKRIEGGLVLEKSYFTMLK